MEVDPQPNFIRTAPLNAALVAWAEYLGLTLVWEELPDDVFNAEPGDHWDPIYGVYLVTPERHIRYGLWIYAGYRQDLNPRFTY